MSLKQRFNVDGGLPNALLVTLGNEEHIIYRLTLVGTATGEPEIPAIGGVLAPEIGAGALRPKAAPLGEELAAITRSGAWTRSDNKVREVDLFSVKIWLYLGNRSAVESIQEVCEGMAA